MQPEYILGVDLGQTNDYTALAVLEVHTTGAGRSAERSYQVRHLDRLPLGTPYPQQVEVVTRTLELVEAQQHADRSEATKRDPWIAREYPPRDPRLVVDQTGVGRPVVDMLRSAGHRGLTAVTIHGGDTTTRDGLDHRVPKRELVAIVQVLLQTGRLTVASALLHAQTLTKELLAFRVTFSKTGHDTYGNDWRENDHDDLVLAVALAAWAGERGPQGASMEAIRALGLW